MREKTRKRNTHLSYEAVVVGRKAYRDHVWLEKLVFRTIGTNLVFAQTHLIVDRAVVHFKKRNVVFVGELVKVPVGDHFPDLAVDVAVGLVRVQHMVLPNPHQEVTGGNVPKLSHKNWCILMNVLSNLYTMGSSNDPTVG